MRRLVAALVAILVATPASAFKLQAVDAPLLSDSAVHERITQRGYELAGEKLPADVIAGVRWNDNPPFLKLGAFIGGCDSQMAIDAGIDCWTSLVRVDRMAREVISRRENTLETIRSHFGDLQFLHAMAPRAGESAEETREKATRWAEFAYRIARGEIEGRVNVFDLRRSRSALDPATATWIGELFRAPSKKHWAVQDVFFARGAKLKAVAFGSLLHLVEDSYSAAHVRRASIRVQANGCPSYDATDPIVGFHTYSGQDAAKHGLCDDPPDWLESPRPGSPVDVIATLVRAYRDAADWPVVKEILEKQVFRLADKTEPAGTGRCFELKADATFADGSAVPPTSLDADCLTPR